MDVVVTTVLLFIITFVHWVCSVFKFFLLECNPSDWSRNLIQLLKGLFHSKWAETSFFAT